METKFTFTVDKAQIVALCKKQANKATKSMLILAIISLVLLALFLVVHFVVVDFLGFVMATLFISVFSWLMVIFIRRAAPKNAEKFFKYYAVDGVITYGYEICETDFIVTQPVLGNVSHYKYEMLQRITDYGDCVAAMLYNNQFLPIPVTEQTVPLISTLKSIVLSVATKRS